MNTGNSMVTTDCGTGIPSSSTGLSPEYSASRPASCCQAWEGGRRWRRPWAPADPDGVLDSWLQRELLQPAEGMDSRWAMPSSLSLALCHSTFLTHLTYKEKEGLDSIAQGEGCRQMWVPCEISFRETQIRRNVNDPMQHLGCNLCLKTDALFSLGLQMELTAGGPTFSPAQSSPMPSAEGLRHA